MYMKSLKKKTTSVLSSDTLSRAKAKVGKDVLRML